MKILDRYILKKFVTTYVFVVLILSLVICVIDFTEKNDDFIKTGPTTGEILIDYYLNLIPYYVNLLSPITVFIAVVFVTARLASHVEITAMLSSGMSFARLLVPYLYGAVLIGGTIFYLIGWVIPDANEKRIAFELAYTRNPYYYDGRDVHMKVAPNVYAYLESYNNTIDVGYQFTLETIEDNRMLEKLKAKKITWQEEEEKWQLEHYVVHRFDSGLSVEQGERLDTTLNMRPGDFGSDYGLHETMTIPELDRFIAELRERGADNVPVYEIEKAQRYTYPFAILILTVIGAILSGRKTREGAGLQIAIGFLLAFVYILFFLTSKSMAQGGAISPYLAPWIPNFVFITIGGLLYRYVPR
ncbi:MAG: LptF/LptG family permease [Catalinimonas sp.]